MAENQCNSNKHHSHIFLGTQLMVSISLSLRNILEIDEIRQVKSNTFNNYSNILIQVANCRNYDETLLARPPA